MENDKQGKKDKDNAHERQINSLSDSDGLIAQGLITYYEQLPPDFIGVSDLSADMVDHEVQLQAVVSHVRRQGGIAFLELLEVNSNNSLQVVISVPQGEPREQFKNLGIKKGSIIKLKGVLRRRPVSNVVDDPGMNRFAEFEFHAEVPDIRVSIQPEKQDSALSWSNLIEAGLVTPEFYGEIIRMPEFKRIQKLREGVSRAFLAYFTTRGYTEVTVPALTQSVSESGAEVFKVQGRNSTLALNQSPQQAKQVMAAIFEKVVTKGQFFRDDPSFTAHHLAEFTGLDMEIVLKHEDKWQAMGSVMHELEGAIRAMVDEMSNHTQALLENDSELPTIPEKGIPIIHFKDAINLVLAVNSELTDFNRTAEDIVAAMIKNETGSDFYFIVGFPETDKPFYTDIAGDGSSFSFDLIYRGVEISSGGLRINDPGLLRQRLGEKGFTDLQQFADYFDTFERGTPQTGGFGLGLDRFLANSLGGINVRLTTLFPKTARSAIG